jgi:hypothetical protein
MREPDQPGRQGRALVRRSACQTFGPWRWVATIAVAALAGLTSACSSDGATDPSRSSNGSDRTTAAQRPVSADVRSGIPAVRGGIGCRGPRVGFVRAAE